MFPSFFLFLPFPPPLSFPPSLLFLSLTTPHHLSPSSLFSVSSFPRFSRGYAEAPQRAGEEQLHGAEFPRPQPCAQHPHQPGLRGAGQEERGPHRPGAGALARQPGGRAVGGGWCLRRGPHRLPCHAGLPQEPLELPEPRPQIPSGSTACRRAHQVAARPPAGQEAAAQRDSLLIFIYLRLQVGEGIVFFLRGRRKQSGFFFGGWWGSLDRKWGEWFSDPPTGFLLLGDYAGFAISVSQCIYFSSHGWVLLWSNVAISSIHFAAEWIMKSAFKALHGAQRSCECVLSTLVADKVLLQKGLSYKTYCIWGGSLVLN